ncbi:MAG: hypothetical protein HRT86_12280 [Ilumatobacteraceae bacterium]|nr:hypothetical protein [Ilumatobacteraceae bacterium]
MRRSAALIAALIVLAACGADSGGDGAVATTAEAATTAAPTTAATDTTTAPTTDGATTTEATAPPTTESAETTAPATTEPDPGVTPTELAAAGPFEVGATTRVDPALATDGATGEIEIWYPATDEAAGATDGYDVREYLPAAIADLVPPEVNARFEIAAGRDATAAADGPYPLVLFSHGAASFRTQSSDLARHLASWGFVVASTDHPSRNLTNGLIGATEGQRDSASDMRQMRVFLETLPADDPVAGVLDTSVVGLAGHSAGGGTIAQVASDPGVVGYASYASGLGDAAADVPSLFMAGALDISVDPIETTTAAYEAAPSPSWLWIIENAGHNAFSDLCAIGGDATLIDLAEQAGIGDFVDDGLRRLATDGCEPPNAPVQTVWPAINQASTGFFRWAFGIDAEPIGLDASAVTPGVTVESK